MINAGKLKFGMSLRGFRNCRNRRGGIMRRFRLVGFIVMDAYLTGNKNATR